MPPAVLRSEGDVEAKLLQPLFREVLGYPDEDLSWNAPVKITLGRETRTKQADLIVNRHGAPMIAVEAKKPTEPVLSYLGQVDSYAFALSTPYSVITNGSHFVLRGYYSFNSRINVVDEAVDDLRRNNWRKLKNLISFESILATVEPANVIQAPDDELIKDYRRFFRKIHNAIRDRDKLDPAAAFDELSKLLFLKAAEEEWRRDRAQSKSVLTPQMIKEWETIGKARDLVNEWFEGATSELFAGVFGDHPQIVLAPDTLRDVLRMMQPFHVKDGDVDVKGRAFEEFLPSQLRGKGLGQFFTPRPVVDFMVNLAGISIQDIVVDFACGSGGFLIKAFEQMKRGIDELPAGTIQRLGVTREALIDEVKALQIFGIDAEPRAARTAKMNMLMWGDGQKVVRGNALDTTDFNGEPYQPPEYDPRNQSSGCTLILANPPFGSKERNQKILKSYALGSKYQERTSERTEVLFLEKGLKLLRPEGRMLIVLPQGLMSGASNARVRDFLHSEAEIRAIISLPTHAFVQSGVPTVNTCILYLQKFTTEKKELYEEKTRALNTEQIRTLLREDPEFDYNIFMGTAEFIGYEPSGRMIVADREQTDLDLLCDDFMNQSDLSDANIDLFEFASKHHGEKSYRRREQTIRGTRKGLKTSFAIPLSATLDRLDPPFYLLRRQGGDLIDSLPRLGRRARRAGETFRPRTDDELDAEYSVLSVSSDGRVSLNELRKGEDLTRSYKRVHHNDIVYNPMRINIGSIGVVPKELDNGLASPDYVVFRTEGVNPEFLVDLLRCPFYRMYIDVVTTGSIRDRLYFGDLQDLRVPDIDQTSQAQVAEYGNRIDDETARLLRQIAAERDEANSRLHGLVRTAAEKTEATEETFRILADRWRRETSPYSSMSKKLNHPAYRRIIEMGEKAIPYILRELQDKPGHWFAALSEITGTSPVPNAAKRSVNATAKAWLDWGRQHGYLEAPENRADAP